jgi:hypothetical protein
MGRIAGTPNKITKEVKEKLQDLVDKVIDNIDISELDRNQKIKLLQIGLQYIVPRLKHTTQDEGWFEQPLFPDVEIISRNEEGGWDAKVHKRKAVEDQIEALEN